MSEPKLLYCRFAGVLEMDGFKDSFAHLYNNSLKDDNASDVGSNQTRGCSAGNGAESDSVIVSVWYKKMLCYR